MLPQTVVKLACRNPLVKQTQASYQGSTTALVWADVWACLLLQSETWRPIASMLPNIPLSVETRDNSVNHHLQASNCLRRSRNQQVKQHINSNVNAKIHRGNQPKLSSYRETFRNILMSLKEEQNSHTKHSIEHQSGDMPARAQVLAENISSVLHRITSSASSARPVCQRNILWAQNNGSKLAHSLLSTGSSSSSFKTKTCIRHSGPT